MFPIFPVGNYASAAPGGNVDSTLNFKQIPAELAGRPAGVLALIYDVSLSLNSAAGGAGVLGRNMFDCLQSVFVKTGHPAEPKGRVRNLSGGHARIKLLEMIGIEPAIPADLAAAGGAVTRTFRIIIPMVNLGAVRPRDHAAPAKLLKEMGELQTTFATWAAALGGNANDTITALTATVSVMMDAFKEGEVPQPIEFTQFDRNGSARFEVTPDRYESLLIVNQGFSGVEIAAGVITQVDSLFVGSNEVMRKINARTVVEQFNLDRIRDVASRRVAPVDTAAGLSDFFPLLWKNRRQSLTAVPYGQVTVDLGGTISNVRLLATTIPDQTDTEREALLIAMGYDPDAVKSVPAEARVPKTTRPGLAGHLKMSPRKRALLPQVWHGLTKAHRKAS